MVGRAPTEAAGTPRSSRDDEVPIDRRDRAERPPIREVVRKLEPKEKREKLRTPKAKEVVQRSRGAPQREHSQKAFVTERKNEAPKSQSEAKINGAWARERATKQLSQAARSGPRRRTNLESNPR